MVGDIDLIYDVGKDVADQLKANPMLEVSVRPSISFVYLALDAANRSGFNHFKDKRVREAIMRGIDRTALVKALQPAEIAAMPLQNSMCHPWHAGCAVSNTPPAYDPNLARKLLADAGLPNGFNVTIATWGPARYAAEAAAGQLRRIGINATLGNAHGSRLCKKARRRRARRLHGAVGQWWRRSRCRFDGRFLL